jgi:hypothetical protein
MNEVEKAKQIGIGLCKLGIALEKQMVTWAAEDQAVVRDVFASYDIPVFPQRKEDTSANC